MCGIIVESSRTVRKRGSMCLQKPKRREDLVHVLEKMETRRDIKDK
jgi:hypothetical protein